MATRKLTSEQENWLFDHYPDMTNKEIAKELTMMVQKDIDRQLKRFRQLLEEDFNGCTKKVILRKIQALEKFSGISEALVKRYARELHCPGKSREHLISCNQEKAKATNIKRWLKKAEKVEHVVEWLRSFKEKDIRFCIIEGDGHLKSMRVSINKFNRYEGYNRRIYLTSQFIPEVCLLRVNASLFRTTQ